MPVDDDALQLPDEDTVRRVRGCLSICLYDIIWGPADEHAAEVMASKLLTGGTVINDPAVVPGLLRVALAMPAGFLESFDLPHAPEAIARYLEHLDAALRQRLGSAAGVRQ